MCLMSGTRETDDAYPPSPMYFSLPRLCFNPQITLLIAPAFYVHYASVNQYHKGILKSNSVAMCTTMLTALSVLTVQGGSGDSGLQLAYCELCLLCKV